MPELPEVEVVRSGLALAVAGARVVAVDVLDVRSLKRHRPFRAAGAGIDADAEPTAAERVADFERRLTGVRLLPPVRRGKFLWVPIAGAAVSTASGATAASAALADTAAPADTVAVADRPRQALLAHLGMSGQMLLRSHEAPDDRHVRIRLWLEHAEHGELRLDFADQRLFGSLALDGLQATGDGHAGGRGAELAAVPTQVTHIARDPLDPAFDDDAFVRQLRSRQTAVKRALLDQGLVSGIGNIYADEALWRARVHPETAGARLSVQKVRELLAAVRAVFAQALAEGGTSFDAQYVNVNGQAGYFAHSLHAYGRGGEPCPRCGTAIKRIPFAGRSSHFCPRCQRKR